MNLTDADIKKLEELVYRSFREGVDETLMTLTFTDKHPTNDQWESFIQEEWSAARDHLLGKLQEIIQ